MDIIAVWLIDIVLFFFFLSFLQDGGMYCMYPISLFHRAESSPFCN